MTAGIVIIFAGYTIASYGVCLLRDYDVPWKRWINPLDPWQWAELKPIPAGQIWPT